MAEKDSLERGDIVADKEAGGSYLIVLSISPLDPAEYMIPALGKTVAEMSAGDYPDSYVAECIYKEDVLNGVNRQYSFPTGRLREVDSSELVGIPGAKPFIQAARTL